MDTLKVQKTIDFKGKIEESMKKEEEKLDQLFNSIVLNLSSKFEQLRKTFHDDVGNFLKSREKEFTTIDSTRKDYIDFVQSYFPQLNFELSDQIKDGIEIVISKYYGDADLHSSLKITQEALPLIKTNEKFEISLNKRAIADLKWRIFADKDIYLDGKPVIRYNSAKTCGDITFTNDDCTVKKKGAYASSTVIGDAWFNTGVTEWEVEINEMNGSYICIGAINNTQEWNLKGDNYTNAHCVCSDGCAYGLDKVEGNLSMNVGDIISFTLDLNEGKLTATGPNNKYVYSVSGLKGKDLTPFLGFASGATYMLTIRSK